MSHGNDKAVGGLLSIAFHTSESLRKALTAKGDNPKEVSKFMVKYYLSMREELSKSISKDDD
jgi:chromosome condensin MukBEF ATPase and DNA-binding subunit MukB